MVLLVCRETRETKHYFSAIDVITGSRVLLFPVGASLDRLAQEVARQWFVREDYTFDISLAPAPTQWDRPASTYGSFGEGDRALIEQLATSYHTRKNDLPNGKFLPDRELT